MRNVIEQGSGAIGWNQSGLVHGGRVVYGVAVGVILLDTQIPRPVGDVGNARTFDYPVLYDTATGASTKLVVENAACGLLEQFIDTAQTLVRRGVRALSTSCGFLSIYQRELAARIDAIIATSALLQIPTILRMLGPEFHVGVITANASTLGAAHLAAAGIAPDDYPRLTFVGLEQTEYFYPVIVGGASQPLDVPRTRDEVVAAAKSALVQDPAIRAFVLECTNLPPYSAAIRASTGIPVWDVTTMLNWMEEGARYPSLA